MTIMQERQLTAMMYLAKINPKKYKWVYDNNTYFLYTGVNLGLFTYWKKEYQVSI